MRKIPAILLVLLLFFSCQGNIQADLTQKIQGQGNRHLTYTLSPSEIWVGVPVTLVLDIKGEQGDDVIFTKADSLNLPESLRLVEATADDNRFTLIVKADKPGEYTIPPLSVFFENKNEDVELLTRPMVFSVLSLVEEGTEPSFSGLWKGMKIGFLPMWQLLVVLLGLILIGLVLFWLLYWRKRERATPPEPVWSILERELSQLSADSNLLDSDRGQFYDLTSSLVKKALDGVYHQHTGEQTREEFSSSLSHIPGIEGEVKLWLTRFFERADLVRFAKAHISRDVSLADLDEVIRFTGQAVKKAKEPEPHQLEENSSEPKRKESL